jgi:hypothetical protein
VLLALAGRLAPDVADYLKRTPAAAQLVRVIAREELGAVDLAALTRTVERMAADAGNAQDGEARSVARWGPLRAALGGSGLMADLAPGTRVRITRHRDFWKEGKLGRVLTPLFVGDEPANRYLVRLDEPFMEYGSHGEWRQNDVVDVAGNDLERIG